MTTAGELVWRIGGDTKSLRAATASGEGMIRRLGAAANRVNTGMGAALSGPLGAFIGTAAGLAGIRASVSGMMEQERAERARGAVIKATGNAAGFTARQLNEMASEMQRVTTFGDEVVINAQAILASFKEVKGDVFKDAIKSAADMSAVMGTDLQSSIMQIGKALNDPVLGATMLRRVGVALTEQQMAQIKTLVQQNRLLDAQRLILAELQSEFGGAAEAIAKGAGQITQFKNAIGDLGETIAAKLLGLKDDGFITTMIGGITALNNLISGGKLNPDDPDPYKEMREAMAETGESIEKLRGRLASVAEVRQQRLGSGSLPVLREEITMRQQLIDLIRKQADQDQVYAMGRNQIQQTLGRELAGRMLELNRRESGDLAGDTNNDVLIPALRQEIELRQKVIAQRMAEIDLQEKRNRERTVDPQIAGVQGQIDELRKLEASWMPIARVIESAKRNAKDFGKTGEDAAKAIKDRMAEAGRSISDAFRAGGDLARFRIDVQMIGADDAQRRMMELSRQRDQMVIEAQQVLRNLTGVSPEQRAAISKELMDGIAAGFTAERDKAIKEMAKSQADTFSFSGAQEAAKSFQVALLGKNSEQIAERQLRAQLTAAEEARKTEKNTGNMANVVGQIAGMIRESLPKLLTAPMGVGN